MSAAPEIIELRPMGIGDILDGTFRLYKARFLQFFVIALVANVPYAIYEAMVDLTLLPPGASAASVGEPPFFLSETERPASEQGVPEDYFLLRNLGYFVFSIVVLPVAAGALIVNVAAAVFGEKRSAAASYARALRRIIPLVFTQLLVYLAVGLGLIALVVPAIIFWLWFTFSSVIVVLERRVGTGAMERSRDLIRGNLGKGFLLRLMLFLLVMIIGVGGGALSALIPWPPFVEKIAESLLYTAILPIQIAPLVLFYYDLRVRKEGFDLECLAGPPPLAARPVKAV